MAQSSQAGSARVLCICADVLLLSTRQLVLSLRYATVAVTSTAEMRQLAGESFDAVVVCHTLSAEECETAVQLALQQWSHAEIIILARAEPNCVQHVDRVVRSTAGPEFLLNTVDRLLQSRGNRQISLPWTPGTPGSGTAAGGV